MQADKEHEALVMMERMRVEDAHRQIEEAHRYSPPRGYSPPGSPLEFGVSLFDPAEKNRAKPGPASSKYLCKLPDVTATVGDLQCCNDPKLGNHDCYW